MEVFSKIKRRRYRASQSQCSNSSSCKKTNLSIYLQRRRTSWWVFEGSSWKQAIGLYPPRFICPFWQGPGQISKLLSMRPEVIKEKSAEDVWNHLEGVITHFKSPVPRCWTSQRVAATNQGSSGNRIQQLSITGHMMLSISHPAYQVIFVKENQTNQLIMQIRLYYKEE